MGCTVEGRLAGGTRACGFVGSATLDGGEIARCAVFADVSTLANSTDGMAAGFAGSLSLSGGAVVRECFSAGVVDAAADAAGFACEISMRDDQSQVRDSYSTAEVLSGENQNPAGFACRISDNNDEGGVLPVANCWFGGTVRCRGKGSDYYKPYGFAYYLTGDVSFENCAWIEVPGVKEAGTAGVTALSQAASRKAASWPGYDFAGTWSISEDSTTPYFAWSLAEGTDFRLFAVQEEGKPVSIGESAAPGAEAAVSAVAEDSDLIFCGWTGGAFYTNAVVTPSAILADNHRTARCVWGKAIRTRADLAAVASDPSGTYGLAADIDLGGEPWTPLCLDEYEPFTGSTRRSLRRTRRRRDDRRPQPRGSRGPRRQLRRHPRGIRGRRDHQRLHRLGRGRHGHVRAGGMLRRATRGRRHGDALLRHRKNRRQRPLRRRVRRLGGGHDGP